MNLYDLTNQQLALKHKLESMNLDEQTVEDTLEGELGDIEQKCESIAIVRGEFLAMAKARKEEAERLLKLAAEDEKKADGLGEYVKVSLERLDLKTLATKLFKFTIKQNPPSIKIFGDVPQDFYVQKPPPKPEISKALLKEAIERGDDTSGFAELERKTRLEIK